MQRNPEKIDSGVRSALGGSLTLIGISVACLVLAWLLIELLGRLMR